MVVNHQHHGTAPLPPTPAQIKWWYTLNKKLYGQQSHFGHFGEGKSLAAVNKHIHYTNCAILTPILYTGYYKLSVLMW